MSTAKADGVLCFSLVLLCLLTDYHWDRHRYFVITPTSCTDYDSYDDSILVLLLVVSGL
jgi:hypothetical protein